MISPLGPSMLVLSATIVLVMLNSRTLASSTTKTASPTVCPGASRSSSNRASSRPSIGETGCPHRRPDSVRSIEAVSHGLFFFASVRTLTVFIFLLSILLKSDDDYVGEKHIGVDHVVFFGPPAGPKVSTLSLEG